MNDYRFAVGTKIAKFLPEYQLTFSSYDTNADLIKRLGWRKLA
jgi:hypothetical protein